MDYYAKHSAPDNTISSVTDNKKAYNWLISIAVNAAILAAVLYLTEVVYETNDDFAIAREITAGYPYVGFVNVFLCKVLIIIQNALPQQNIFVLSQMALSFVCFTVLLKIFIDRRESWLEVIPALFVCALFSFDHYSSVQFTKTSALLMTAGLIWAVDNYCHERKTVTFVSAFLLFYIGVAFREKGMFPAIAYAGAFMLIWWIVNRKEVFVKGGTLRELGLICLILVILVAPHGIDKLSDRLNESTPELKLAREYQAERRMITDYPAMKYYEENKDKYDAAGLSENDIFVVDRWIFDYDGSASLENLKTINSINAPYRVSTMTPVKALKKAVKSALLSVKDLNFTGLHVLIALLLFIYVLLMNKPEGWVYALMAGAVTLLIYVAIYYMQRPQYRALYVADAGAAFWLLYISVTARRRSSVRMRAAAAVVIAAAVVLMAIPARQILDGTYSHNKAQLIPSEQIEYFADNADKFFIGPTTSMGMSPAFADPLGRAESPANMADTGGWDTMSPYRLEALGRYGIHNPVKDLIDNPGVLYVGDGKRKILTEYFNKWYCKEGESVQFEKVDEVDGTNIYKVVKH